MHPLLRETGHRPWALPRRGWIWHQSWLDLAFIHYRVDADQIRRMLPRDLQVQEFEGTAWVGLVPFRMAGVARRPFPGLPYLSSFPELNLRTYVVANEKPGVWFFSLDAASWPTVIGGRLFYGVPYHHARITMESRAGWFEYACGRRGGAARFHARYRPFGAPYYPKSGSFENWAAERYCLYSSAGGGIARTEVHHRPWPMQGTEVEIDYSNIMEFAGIAPLEPKPRCHFSTGVDVLSFPPEKVASP